MKLAKLQITHAFCTQFAWYDHLCRFCPKFRQILQNFVPFKVSLMMILNLGLIEVQSIEAYLNQC